MSAGPFDLELLREILKDSRLHLGIGQIKTLFMASDRSVLRAKVLLLPDEHEIIARVSWPSIGPNAGFIQLPQADDMVLIGQAEGDPDHAFIIARLSSRTDTIPAEAAGGDLVARSLAGKHARLISDAAIWLSKPGSTPLEPLVLGLVFQDMMSTVLEKLATTEDKLKSMATKIAAHTHVGNFGFPTSVPRTANDFTQLALDFDGLKEDMEEQKASPVDDSAILSDLSFTEKGS